MGAGTRVQITTDIIFKDFKRTLEFSVKQLFRLIFVIHNVCRRPKKVPDTEDKVEFAVFRVDGLDLSEKISNGAND